MRGNQKNKAYKLVWTPEFAYAVGLLTTDGCLSKDGRHIIFVSKDKDLIESFKKCLKLDNKIGLKKSTYTGRKDCYYVQFSHSRFYKELLKIGLFPNKSKTIGKLKIPKDYFFDFLRGHFDGDGSCYSYWDKRWSSSFMFYIVFSSSSLLHIKWIRSKIEEYIGIKGTISKARDLHFLRFAKKPSRLLIEKMYYNEKLPCLNRKDKKLKSILKEDNKENIRKAQVMELVDICA